jgi:uncharacterized protein YuzE
MEETVMESFRIFYDEEQDILYFGVEGEEEEVIELYPGINIELDSSGKIIGIEAFNASHLFKDVIRLMEKKLQNA